jgi:hypothetical protein
VLELAGKQAGRGSEPTSTICANAVRVIVDASVDEKVRDEAMKVIIIAHTQFIILQADYQQCFAVIQYRRDDFLYCLLIYLASVAARS